MISLFKKLADPSAIPEGYSAQPLGDGYFVMFTSNANKAPIARLKITAGRVWAASSQFDYAPGRKLYPLLDIDGFDGCSLPVEGVYEDPRFEFVASINEQRLFDENKVTPHLSSLPEYNTDDGIKYDWNLYSSAFYEWNYECIKYQELYENVT